MNKNRIISTFLVLVLLASFQPVFSGDQNLGSKENKVSIYRMLWRYIKDELKSRRLRIPPLKDVMSEIGEPTRGALSKDSIKVLVWNMYKGDKPDWERDFLFLARGHDILVLQEMYLGKTMKRVFNQHTEYHYKLATSFIYKDENIRTGLATAAQVEPTSVFFQRSNVLEPVINTPKMSLFTHYPIKDHDKDLMVINIHAINFVTTWGLAQQIKEIAKVIKAYDGPTIFAGDFNTWSEEKIRYLKHQMHRLNLTEVVFDPDTRMRTFKNPLDYVFTKGLVLKSANVWGDLDGSDHKALDVEFSVEIK
ncbi:MAG: endonuclease/exonuclease/phosphatase family protein [Halobacteriovoraceae bacterium]|jgi:endonuclease/exonuclease/phosphatase (EEP) superfamily protein YafD|nr:endonuclease/exonuclease/phosphatase family protein [Halobacteriovoraceae bacterium]MBT5095629.1 endonuclease/exonuclease/phosphatase family protein [Halobacteriovoraceae bacterium]